MLTLAELLDNVSVLQLMSSKWTDAVIQVLNFDFGSLPDDLDDEGIKKAVKFGDTFVHLISLMHGVAIQNLRRDWDLKNTAVHDEKSTPPPIDATELSIRGHGQFSWKDIFYLRSDRRHKEKYHQVMKIHILGGLTPDEEDALGTTKEEDDLGGVSRGCHLENGIVVPGPAERVQVLYTLK